MRFMVRTVEKTASEKAAAEKQREAAASRWTVGAPPPAPSTTSSSSSSSSSAPAPARRRLICVADDETTVPEAADGFAQTLGGVRRRGVGVESTGGGGLVGGRISYGGANKGVEAVAQAAAQTRPGFVALDVDDEELMASSFAGKKRGREGGGMGGGSGRYMKLAGVGKARR
jgi:hypothetical protein